MPIGKNGLLLNPILYEYYHKKIGEGKMKNQALKSVQRRLVNIIYSVMKNNRPYENPASGYVPKEEVA